MAVVVAEGGGASLAEPMADEAKEFSSGKQGLEDALSISQQERSRERDEYGWCRTSLFGNPWVDLCPAVDVLQRII